MYYIAKQREFHAGGETMDYAVWFALGVASGFILALPVGVLRRVEDDRMARQIATYRMEMNEPGRN